MSVFHGAVAAAMMLLAAAGPGRAEVSRAFTVGETLQEDGLTALAVSPEGDRLYAATIFGALLRWRIDPETGALTGRQKVEPALFQTDAGPRGLFGLAFDPESPDKLWLTDNYPVPLSGKHPEIPDFSGRVTRLAIAPGAAFAVKATPYVTGLPRSCADHLTNSLAFAALPGENGAPGPVMLYLTQGSNSSMGERDGGWCMRPERLLNAAILEIDPRRTPPEGGFDVTTEPLPGDGYSRRIGYTRVLRSWSLPEHWGALKEDPISIPDGPWAGKYLVFDARGVATVRATADVGGPLVHSFYDPYAPDAPVRLFATGLRNAYDLVAHPNGWIYTAVNGSSGSAVTPDDPRTPIDEGLTRAPRQQDMLHRLRRGDYGGHPNTLRDEYVSYGGNPTEGEDPFELSVYPVGLQPDPRFHIEQVYGLGNHWAPTGMAVYRGPSPLDGAILFANYSRGDTIRAIVVDEDGGVAEDFELADPAGAAISSTDPIDIAVGPGGRIWMATLPRSNGKGLILRLDPDLLSTRSN